MLALQKVLNGPPDGQLIYMGGTDTVVIPMVNRTFKHQWDRDLAPIGRMTTVPMIFAVPATSKFSNLSELLGDLQKSGSDRFSYATPGIGTMQHLYGALLNERAKTSMLHIPYRGGAQIVNDLVGHQVDSAVLVLSTAMPFLKDGKIKALSVSDAARVPSLPNVQRIGEEVGFNGLSLPLWQGLFVKAGTPREITSAYEKAMLEAVSVQSVKSKLAESGVTVSPLTGQQLTDFIRPQAKLYHDIVEAAKISLK